MQITKLFTPLAKTYQKSVDKFAADLNVRRDDGSKVSTLDQLQLTASSSSGQAAHDLNRAASLIKARAKSESHGISTSRRFLATAAAVGLGLGMVATGGLGLGLLGAVVTVGANAPLAMAVGSSLRSCEVLTNERSESLKDGVLPRDEFYYAPRNVDGFRTEAAQVTQAYADRATGQEWNLVK